MKTSEILIKAGQIYIEAGKKIAEAEKILGNISGIGAEKVKYKKEKGHKKQKVRKVKDDTGSKILDKLTEFNEKTERIAKDLTGK